METIDTQSLPQSFTGVRTSPDIYMDVSYQQEGAEEFLPTWIKIRVDRTLVSLILEMESVRDGHDMDLIAHHLPHAWGPTAAGDEVAMRGERVVIEKSGDHGEIYFTGYEESTEVVAKTRPMDVAEFLHAIASGQVRFPATASHEAEVRGFRPKIVVSA